MNILDLLTTLFIVSTYGIDAEQAIIAKTMMAEYHHWGLIALKVGVVGLLSFLVIKYKNYTLIRSLYFSNYIFLFIVLNNLYWTVLILFPELVLI